MAGAWTFYYREGFKASDDRQRAGIKAIKQELIYNGYDKGIDLTMVNVFGTAVSNRSKEFQAANGLVSDGVVGPNTALVLFRKRCRAAESSKGIPDKLVGRTGTLESNNDPIAEGYADPEDEGWGQIHLPFFPNVSIEQAWDPAYAIPFTANKLASDITYCDNDVDGGLAAYNVGRTYARRWVRAGKPASGGPELGGEDAYVRATRYVELVRGSRA